MAGERMSAIVRRIPRRRMLGMLAAPAVFASASAYGFRAGRFRFFNPCLDAVLPEPLASHEIVARAFDGIDPMRVIDAHVHLLGDDGGVNGIEGRVEGTGGGTGGETGGTSTDDGGRGTVAGDGTSGGTGMDNDGDDGPWIGEQMRSPLRNPLQYARYRVFLNASCVRRQSEDASGAFLDRLLACHRATAPGSRLMLLAFDQVYDEGGRARPETTAFHVPDTYARIVAARYPGELAWAASVHPYRADAVEALDAAAADGARAVKWLPNAMGIDPASPSCDRFYETLARHRLPLLTHGGRERAVRGTGDDTLGNPLRLRRALDHGVRVIVAHCASFGAGVDLDAGPGGSAVPNLDLFTRLMDDPRYEHLLMGDVSALTQANRFPDALGAVLERKEWHGRLLNGSDYPLPGVPALYDLERMAEHGFLAADAVPVLEAIQDHNPLMFDFVLKRTVASHGARFSPRVFETARHLDPPAGQ